VVAKLSAMLRSELRLERNLRDWEILPRGCRGKGDGVLREISRNGTRDALPIYIGDDVSDEAAFRALRKGITICVGRRTRTNAKYFVGAPGDVGTILRGVAEAMTR
jgi:trehalose 6-phosphate phosphatase